MFSGVRDVANGNGSFDNQRGVAPLSTIGEVRQAMGLLLRYRYA